MVGLKKIIQAGTITVLTGQAACSSSMAVSPVTPTADKPETTDIVDFVRDHWAQNYDFDTESLRNKFDSSKINCSAEKKKLALSMSCHVPSKHPKHKRDGLYFEVYKSNIMEGFYDTAYKFIVMQDGRITFELKYGYEPNNQQLSKSIAEFTVPGLCAELVRTHVFQPEDRCSDHQVYSFASSRITSTDQLENKVKDSDSLSFIFGTNDRAEYRFRVRKWFDKQLEEAKKEMGDILKPLEKKFRETIKASNSYRNLIEDKQFEPFFWYYDSLSNPIGGVARLRSSEEDPVRLNSGLREIASASKKLSLFDQSALQNTSVYIAKTTEEMKKRCQSKNAGACYDPKTKTMILQMDNSVDLPNILSHELAHRHRFQLSTGEWLKVKKKLQPILNKREVQKDVIRSKDANLGRSWQDGSKGPRFNCPDYYAASNLDEYTAVYKENLLTNNGLGIISLLRPENKKYHADVITTLETLAQTGFFGDTARGLLDDLYQRASINPREYQ